MKILVIGASGLVGGCMLRALTPHHPVDGTCCSQTGSGLMPLEILDPAAVQDVLQQGYTHVVNCAAMRSPDACLADPETAYRVNALGVEYLAQAANAAGACLCQISTDYVFSGTQPPYHETDTPDPVNLYGRTKRAGEHAARQAKRHLILRIPAQWRTDLTDPRNFAIQIATSLRAGDTLRFDSEIVRFYTLADDVAEALRFLLEKGVEGVVQVSAAQRTSKFDFATRLARALGLDENLVQEAPVPTTGDVRPVDSHLATERYEALGGPEFLGVDEALGQVQST